MRAPEPIRLASAPGRRHHADLPPARVACQNDGDVCVGLKNSIVEPGGANANAAAADFPVRSRAVGCALRPEGFEHGFEGDRPNP